MLATIFFIRGTGLSLLIHRPPPPLRRRPPSLSFFPSSPSMLASGELLKRADRRWAGKICGCRRHERSNVPRHARAVVACDMHGTPLRMPAHEVGPLPQRGDLDDDGCWRHDTRHIVLTNRNAHSILTQRGTRRAAGRQNLLHLSGAAIVAFGPVTVWAYLQ